MISLAITALFLWLAFRDLDLALVRRAIAEANWFILLVVSIPSYILAVWLRALRWRHLTDPIQRIGIPPLFRAVSVAFMTNNIFPLRLGELVRCWYLGRETGVSPASIFGTVILERVIDTVTVIGLAASVLAFWGARSDGLLAEAAVLLLPVAIAPSVVLICLRLAPDRVIAVSRWLLGRFSERLSEYVAGALERFAGGLGALRGGTHLFWIAFHTLGIWLVASTLPMLAGFWALDLDLGGPFQTLVAGWITLAAVGMAVALPQAPGFFGTYHVACKLALEPLGVSPETAVAFGTLVHGVFWVTLTALGLAVLRSRQTSLGDLESAADTSESSASR